jgi:hypothetical protein
VGDDDGGPWEEVVSHKRQASRSPPPPILADLNGLCFNCFSDSHFAARCPHPARCFRCHQLDHREEDCTLPRVLRRRLPGYVPVHPRPLGGSPPPPPPQTPPRRAAQPPPLHWDPQRPPSPRQDPPPPPPPPRRASPPLSPPSRWASPPPTHLTRWASPPPLQPRDPPARPPPHRDGVRRGAAGSRPCLGRGVRRQELRRTRLLGRVVRVGRPWRSATRNPLSRPPVLRRVGP